jgi:hypothetical protein
MNIEKRRTVEGLVQNRLRADTAGTFKASKQYDQEARPIAWTTFSNLNTWFDSFKSIASSLDLLKAMLMVLG